MKLQREPRNAVREHEFRLRSTPLERRAWYNNWLMTTGETASEVRDIMYQQFQHLVAGVLAQLGRNFHDGGRGGARLGEGAVGATCFRQPGHELRGRVPGTRSRRGGRRNGAVSSGVGKGVVAFLTGCRRRILHDEPSGHRRAPTFFLCHR